MIPEGCNDGPFFISIDYFGNDNISPAHEKNMSYLRSTLYDVPLPNYPKPYYVVRGKRPEILVGKDFDLDGMAMV
jgi:hypothetical protein